jgi:HK97 family phage prohead protease
MTETIIETVTVLSRVTRVFSATATAGEGRTVDVRIVPYSTPADVSDDGRTVYREEWAPGAFDAQLVAGHRLKVLLNFEHQSGIGNIVGKGIMLRSQPDGLHGSFEMRDDDNGRRALDLVNDGILDGVSLEAVAAKTIHTTGGVYRRVKAHLHNVALCRNPAFPDARVLAVREQPNIVFDEDLLPHLPDPVLLERLERAGIAVPAGLKAHPVNGTPSLEGTPTDGTRHDGEPETELEDADNGRSDPE